MPTTKNNPYMFTFVYNDKLRHSMEILKGKSINLADFCRKSIESFANQIEETEKQNNRISQDR